MPTTDGALLASRLSWLTALRLAILSLLLAAIGFLYLREREIIGAFSSQVALVAIAVGFVLAGLTAAALRRHWRLGALSYALLVSDQITWTAIAYVSGGVASGATSFYGLTVVIGAVVAGVPGVLVAGATAAILLNLMAGGLATGVLPPPHDQTTGYPTAWRDVSYPLTLNLLVLVVVAVLSAYLAERLRRTSGELREAERRAEQAERLALLGRFAAGLAHEIRNPLGSIAGSVELLATGGSLSTEDKVLCDIISREASRLNDLVGDMLDLARPRKPEPVPVDLANVATEVVRLATQSGRGSDVRVRYEGPPSGVTVNADPAQLRQVLWNLVRNAIQASSAGKSVTVRIANVAGEAVLEVADKGKGIPESAREHLFDAFFTTRTHGVGIGLAVVKRIAEDHGFPIEVDSVGGKGATFRVRIPLESSASDAPAEAPTAATDKA